MCRFFWENFSNEKKPAAESFQKNCFQVIVFFARACYNRVMEKRKIMGIGLSALLFLNIAGSVVCAPAANFAFADETEETEITAPLPGEETGETDPTEPETPETPVTPQGALTLRAENTDLFLPASYEEYLSLENPTDVAISGEYIAVAQANKIYICNRTGEEIAYRCYEHTNGGAEVTISKIQFSEDGKLYFSDRAANFYKLDLNNLTAEKVQDVNASTFCITADILFTAVVTDGTTYSQYALKNLSESRLFDSNSLSKTPQLTFWDGKLYSVVDRTITVYEYNASKNSYVYSPNPLSLGSDVTNGLKSAYALGGGIYYTIDGDNQAESGIYFYDFASNVSEPNTFLAAGSGYGALTAYSGYLYAIEGNSVREYSVTKNSATLTGYEISTSSPSINRLAEAKDTVRAGNLLVTADAENKRVSLYNFSTKKYSVLPCESAPSVVATDGKTIAVACDRKIYTCTYGDTSLTLCDLDLQMEIKGLTCIFGNVFYVTANSRYGMVGSNNEAQYYSYDGTPRCMTSDLYGNIYVSYTNGSVRKFTEDAFISAQESTPYISVPINHTSLRADFEGNLYYLSGDVLYKNGEEFAKINGNDFVYHVGKTDETDAPVSFALGFEDSEVYFFFRNHAIKSKAETLDIPTLSKITAGTIAEDVFSVHNEENLLADVPEKTVGITITLSELAEAEYFPYDYYARLDESSRGVLLGETEKYRLVLLFSEAQNAYVASLFQKKSVTLAEEKYYEEASGQYYLSSNVSSYYVPCLETALAETTLARGASVTVIGYLTAPDYVYALVSFAVDDLDAARTVKTGYVPASFLTTIAPLPADGEEYLPVYLKAKKDGLTLVSEDGEELVITQRTEAKAWKNDDGSYTVCVSRDGKNYYGTVSEKQIDRKESGALRIALIIILSVLALVILGAYIFLLPRKTQEAKAVKKEKAEQTSAKKE